MLTYPAIPGLRIDEIDRAMEHIAQALHAGEADFLFGAGMSADSGVPMGRQLSRKLLDKFFPPASANRPSDEELDALIDQFPFEALVQGVEFGLTGRPRLTSVLKELLLSAEHHC